MKKNLINFWITIIFLVYASQLLAAKHEVATFAGGCFWSMQHDFDKVPGVVKTTVGYTGGSVVNPTYEQVSTGNTGHYEAIEVVYDPRQISYQQLVNFFWHSIDPSDSTGQFCDHGSEYRSVIFYRNANEQTIATQSKNNLIKSHQFENISTLIMPAKIFYPAENYHQKYAEKNPITYKIYRINCGRDAHREKIWGLKSINSQ